MLLLAAANCKKDVSELLRVASLVSMVAVEVPYPINLPLFKPGSFLKPRRSSEASIGGPYGP
jgi:hypothetical protein